MFREEHWCALDWLSKNFDSIAVCGKALIQPYHIVFIRIMKLEFEA